MTFMNWLPELIIFLQLFVVLACLNFKPISHRSLPLICSVVTSLALVYFGYRTDLAFFESPAKVLISDSLSLFGRLFSLLFLALGTLNFHFHRRLTFGAKQRGTLFLLFFSLFLCGVFQANSVLLYSVCWAGCYLSMTKLVLIESKLSESWILSIRQHALPLAVIFALFSLLFVLIAQTSGSIYTSDFIEWVKTAQEHQTLLVAAGGIIFALGALLLHGLVLRGQAPIALAMMSLFIWVSTSTFWFRLGVPFLNESAILPKAVAQHFLGAILGLFAIRYAVHALRTQDHFRWVSAIYPASIGFGLFALLLSVDHALPAFYALSLSFLFTFFFVGQAFLETEYRNKVLTVFGLIALVGVPPFILGEQYYRLVHDTFEAGLLPITLLLGLVWFILNLSVVQKLGKIILIKNGLGTFRKILPQEIFFLVLFIVCVISLTALRVPLISLLNDHPLPYLW